jgi:hypothetical protein
MLITTEAELLHPVAVIVSVKVYVVVAVGDTDGLADVDVNPEGFDVQLYEKPVEAVPPIVIEPPRHMDEFEPGLTVGKPNTVITTESDLVHPVAVIFSVK